MRKKLDLVRKKVDKRLGNFLNQKEEKEMVEEIQKMISGGGKRLRPALFYHTYKSCGGLNDDCAVDIASALELFHTFALIHDDILDHSFLRRGLPTIYKKIGLEKAILTGDLCLCFANELFYQAVLNLPPAVGKKINSLWLKLQKEMLLGEYLDIDLNLKQVLDKKSDLVKVEERVWQIMDYKTAGYSFERPLLLAAALVEADKKTSQSLSSFGKNLGLAFQIKDDILGIFGNEKETGKSADADLKEGKMTLIMVKFLERLKKEKPNKVYWKDSVWLRKKMKQWQVVKQCQDLAEDLVKKAKKSVRNLKVESEDKMFFLDLADYVLERKY